RKSRASPSAPVPGAVPGFPWTKYGAAPSVCQASDVRPARKSFGNMIVMSWKLWLRRIAVAAAASLVVLALLAAAIEFAVPSRWWTAFLKVQLERELRRPLRLGAARWSLWHGFSAENLWIGELPAQGSGAFLQARVM